jgi:HisJ family histidinol phosphate phosphatase
VTEDPRIGALPDSHGHAKGEHKAFIEERPIPYTARMLFLWFFHACRRGAPRFMMVADHINYLTFEDPAAVHVVRRALKLAQAGDLYGAAETAGVELGHASVVSEGLRKGMRYSIGAEVDNDPRSRPDAQNIVDAMKPDGLIRSVHFLPITHPQHGENWMWPFDNPEFREFYDVVGIERVWELYMEILLDAIDKLPGHIVGHFYVPARFGHWPEDAVLEAYEDKLVDACAERGMAIEINSRYLYKYYVGDEAQLKKFRDVHVRLMGKAKAKGVMIAVGSDAHSPRDQGSAFETILAMLDEADVNEIAFPLNDRLARVALRATEEILRQHSAALAGPPPAVPRGFNTPDPADEDDEEREDGAPDAPPIERRAEGRNSNAEIILPPGSEPGANDAEAETAEPVAEPKVKAPAKPRKSRAKPKPAVAVDAVEVVTETVAALANDPVDAEVLPGRGEDMAFERVEAILEHLSPDDRVAEPETTTGLETIDAAPVEPESEPESEPVAHVEPETQARPVERPAAPSRRKAPAKSAATKPSPKTAAPVPTPVAGPAKVAAVKAPQAKMRPVKAPAKPAPAKTTPIKAALAPKAATKVASAARKTATPAKKATPLKKRSPVKKAAPAKKVAPKKAMKKAAPAKPVAKKAAAKKASSARTKPAPAKRTAPAKRAPAKKTVAKKTAKKKSSRR